MLRVQPEVPLKIFASTDPVVACSFVTPGADDRVGPYDLTGTLVEVYVKPRAEDRDGPALYSTAEGSVIVTDAPSGLASIQFDGHDFRFAGQSRYHVDAVKDGRRTVLAWGSLVVVDR